MQLSVVQLLVTGLYASQSKLFVVFALGMILRTIIRIRLIAFGADVPNSRISALLRMCLAFMTGLYRAIIALRPERTICRQSQMSFDMTVIKTFWLWLSSAYFVFRSPIIVSNAGGIAATLRAPPVILSRPAILFI